MSTTVKVLSAKETLASYTIQKGDVLVVQAKGEVNYQLIDNATGYAPQNILAKRDGKNLVITLDEGNTDPDIIIENYYADDNVNSMIVGLHENGNIYAYVPESGQTADAVSMLAEEMVKPQALGGEELKAALWEFNPWWLVGLAVLGVGIALIPRGKKGSVETVPTNAEVDTVTNSTEVNEGETLVTTVTLTNSNGNPSVAFSRGGNATDADFGSVTFSDGVTQNSDGTLKVPVGISHFTITTPVIADNQTESTPETVSYTVGIVTGTEATIVDTSKTPPVAPTIAPDLTDPSDTGLSNRDDKTADNTPTFAIPALNEGESPVLYVDGVEVASTFDEATNTITPTVTLADGTYQITTATQKDGLTSAQGPALSVLIDTKAPVINKAEVPTSGDKLVLTYNEALDPTNTAVANQFVVKVNGQSIVPASVAVSGSTVTLTLADTQTIKKDQVVKVSYTDPSNANDAKATQDIVGNDAVTLVDYDVINNSGVIIPPVAPTIAPDLTDPSDTGLSNIDDKTADNTPTFAIPALNEGESPVLYINSQQVASTFDEATNTITPTAVLVDGTYQITTATQKDGLTSAQGPALSVLIDTKAPVINKAEVPTSGDKLVLTYNEALDPTNTAVANQFVVKVNGQSIVPASVAVSGSTVTLTLADTQTIKKDQVVKVSYTDPSNANDAKATQDIVGNDAVTLVDYDVINNSGVIIPPVAPTIAPDLTDPSDTGLSNIDDKTADNTPTFAIPALNEGESPVLYINSQQVASTFDEATNTITPTAVLVDGTYQITTATQKDGLTSAQGPALSVLIDTKAPVINKAEVPTSGDKLVLTYNEALDPTNTAVANQFVVKVNGQSIVPASVAVSGSTVTLTLADTQTIKKDQVVKVSYTDPSNANDAKATQDIVGNDAVTLVDYDVINNSGVIIPPVAPTIAPDLTDPSDTGLSNIDDKTADNTPTFAIPALNEGETPVLYINGQQVASTFDEVTNTITPTSILVDGTYQITTATQKDGLTSAQGPAVSVLIDTKAPVINKAEVPTSGDKLVLTYNEALDPTNTPTADKFVVKVNGQSIVPTTVAVSDSTVTLTLADTQTIKKDQVVKVSYTDPSNGNDAKATQDIVGNDAVTLVDYDVINNSGVIIPPVAPTIAPDLTDPSDTGLSHLDDKTADNTPTFAIPALNEGESPVLYVDGVEVASTFNQATNTITPTTILVDGTHQITTATQKDGLTSAQGPALSVLIDTKAPVINKAEVPTSGDKLVLTYNEALDPTNTAVANQFVVKVNGQSIVPASVAVSGSTVTLTLADTQTIKKDQVVKVSYTDPSNGNDAKATQDIVGNDAVTLVDYNVINNSGVIIPPVAPTIAPDLTDPSDTGLSNRDDKTADNTPTFAIPALNEGETPVLYINGQQVASTFDATTNTITPTSILVDGTYQITTATQKDGLTSAQGPALSVLIDTKAPVINKAEVPTSGDKLVLTYNEALDPTNTAVANQFVVKVNGQSIVPASVAVSGSTVTLTLADTQTIKKDQVVKVSYTDPSNGNDAKATQDIVGNDAVTLVDYNVINNSGVIIPPVAPTIAPDLTDPSDTGLSNRDDKTADNTPTFAIPALNEGETPVLYINGQQVASTFDATTNTITPTSILVDGTYQITTATQKDGLTSAQGPALSVLIDTKAPVINKAEVPTSGDKLVLTYNEALDPTNTPTADKFVVKVNGQSIVPASVAVNGSTVTLTLADTQTIKKDQVVKVSYTDPSNANDAKATQDIVGNDAVTLVDYDVINNSGVIIPPVAPTIAPDLTDPSDTGLSNRDDKTADNTPTFAIPALNEGETPVLYINGQQVASTFDEATNTITPIAALADGTYQITTATQKDGLTSAQGPALQNVVIDTKAPVINKAEVPTSGDKLVLTYNEALDPTNTAVANQFVVKVNGQSIVPTTVAVSGSTVTLTLADTQTIKKDQVVKVSYTDPSNANDAKATQDIVGNDVVTLVDYDVINNSNIPVLGTPSAGKTVTDVNVIVPTNDIKLSNVNSTFGPVVDASHPDMTPDPSNKLIAWNGIGGTIASIKLQDSVTGVVHGEDVNSTFELAGLIHNNVVTARNLRETSINLEATITLNGKDVRLNTTKIGTVYMLETPRNSAGGLIPGVPDEDFFIFVPRPVPLTIDGQSYSFNLAATNVSDNDANRQLVEQALPIIARGTRTSTTIPAGLRNLTEAEKATAVYASSPETGSENFVQFGFRLDPVSAGAVRPVGLPESYVGTVADTSAAWTAGTGTGVTLTEKGANTFAVNKNGVEIGEFAGQTNGSYTFKPTAGIKGIDGGETLVATFNKGDHTVSLNLTGKYSNTVAADEDKVDTIYKIKADSPKDIDFKSIGDVEMIDLSLVTAGTLQNVTKAQVTASQNNGLYIKGDVGDSVVLGDVLQVGATTQTDGSGSWTKGATKTGSTIDGDTKVYDIWTNSGTTLYIEQGISVL